MISSMTTTPDETLSGEPIPEVEPEPTSEDLLGEWAGFLDDVAAQRERLGMTETKRRPWYQICICGHAVRYHTKGAGAPQPAEGTSLDLWNDDWRGCRGVLVPKQVEKQWYGPGGLGRKIKEERGYPGVPPPYSCECQVVRPVLEVRDGANFFRCSTSNPVDPLTRGIESIVKKCIERGEPLSKRFRWLPETVCLNCGKHDGLRPHRHLGADEPVILCGSCRAEVL